MQLPVTAVIPTMTNKSGLTRVLDELNMAGIPAIVHDNSVKNLGFAKAVNEGAKQAKTEWVLILNDDVELVTSDQRPETSKHEPLNKIEQLIKVAQMNEWVAVTPLLKKPTGEIENIGYMVLPIGKVKLNFDSNTNTSKDLDGLTAACLLIKRDIFEKVGRFDVSFFAYLEDVDLCLRLKKEGYAFGVATDVSVVHHHQTTAKKLPKKVAWLNMVNWWRIVLKHPNKFILSPTLPHMLLERLRNLSGLMKVSGYN